MTRQFSTFSNSKTDFQGVRFEPSCLLRDISRSNAVRLVDLFDSPRESGTHPEPLLGLFQAPCAFKFVMPPRATRGVDACRIADWFMSALGSLDWCVSFLAFIDYRGNSTRARPQPIQSPSGFPDRPAVCVLGCLPTNADEGGVGPPDAPEPKPNLLCACPSGDGKQRA